MYPVAYEADYLRDRNRLTTFFRLIVAIPWLIVAIFYWLAAYVVVLIAWVALIILGRYPAGMYNFVGGVLRWSMKVSAFLALQTDAWPGFGLSDDPNHPVRVHFEQRAAKQSRLKVFFRFILILPALVVSIFMQYVIQYVAVISWLTIVFRGYQPAAIHNALAYTLSWTTRFSAYALFMRDEYPPVGDEVLVSVDESAAPQAALGYDDQFPAQENDPYGEQTVPYAAQADPTQEYSSTGDPAAAAPYAGAPTTEAAIPTKPMVDPAAPQPPVPPQAPMPPQQPEQPQPPHPPQPPA